MLHLMYSIWQGISHQRDFFRNLMRWEINFIRLVTLLHWASIYKYMHHSYFQSGIKIFRPYNWYKRCLYYFIDDGSGINYWWVIGGCVLEWISFYVVIYDHFILPALSINIFYRQISYEVRVLLEWNVLFSSQFQRYTIKNKKKNQCFESANFMHKWLA